MSNLFYVVALKDHSSIALINADHQTLMLITGDERTVAAGLICMEFDI